MNRPLDRLSKFFVHYCKDIIDAVRKGKMNGAMYIGLKNEKTNEVFETRTESQGRVSAVNLSEQVSSASATATSPAAQRQRLSSVSDTQAENLSWSIDILKQKSVHILEKKDGEIDRCQSIQTAVFSNIQRRI